MTSYANYLDWQNRVGGWEWRVFDLSGGSETAWAPMVINQPVDANYKTIYDKDMTVLSGSRDISGNSTLIAAPAAGTRIVVSSLILQNESSTATKGILHGGNIAQGFGVLGQNQGDGLSKEFPVGREWKLPLATALTLTLFGGNLFSYCIHYYTE